MPNEPRVYWDSCTFIDLIEGVNHDRLPALEAMAQAGENGQLAIVTSTLSLAEVVKLNGLAADDAHKEKLIKDFFENDYIHLRSVDPRVSELARRVVRDHKLKPPDAIHVATALLARTRVLHTYDDARMTPLNGLIHYPDVFDQPLRIEHPIWDHQPTLQFETEIA